MVSIELFNLISVGIFGIVLSAAFCDIVWTRKKVFTMVGGIAVIMLVQGGFYFYFDLDIVEKLYPLITHVPLIVLLCILSRRWLWSLTSVLTAYLCCQLRRWLALLIVAVFEGGSVMQDTAELILTLPMLFVLIRFIAPAVRSVSHYSTSLQFQFGLIPALYYGFDYLTRIYTDLLSTGTAAAVEFMPFMCSATYLLFVVRASKEWRTRSRLEQTQAVLNLQIEQAVREIDALRESQEKTRIYRHDMRHHIQYLSACIANRQLNQAQEYIQEVCSEIEENKVTAFCENEAANLIFSAFAKRAEDSGVSMQVKARIPQSAPMPETDLCVLLANALENALHACVELGKSGQAGKIEVSVSERKNMFLLQITNSCGENVAFEDGIPVTDKPGHGIGVRSICTIVEKYGGICTFSAENGQFMLRISL